MNIPTKTDIAVLRDLGARYAEIAALPIQQEKINLWSANNSLKAMRPMVAIDQLPWHELSKGADELICRVEDPFFREIERYIREMLFRWEHFPVDMVFEPWINIPKAVSNTGFGIDIVEDTAMLDPANSVVGHLYHQALKTYEDIQNIKNPVVTHDEKETERRLDIARDVWNGIIDIRASGIETMFGMWDSLACWLGPTGVFMEIADRPEFVHAVMRRTTDAFIVQLNQYEELGLLDNLLNLTHCTYNYTDGPRQLKEIGEITAKQCWTAGLAQIFGSVSPKTAQEFEYDYIAPIFERFGYVYYGCCDPLHDRMDRVLKLPNVRKVSCSPWCNIDIAAEKIHGVCVASNKPSPAYLATDSVNWDVVEKDLRHVINACRRTNTPVEFILKDVSTIRYDPQRLFDWAKLAMRIVCE